VNDRLLPLGLRLARRGCVVVGGGTVALRRTRALVAAGARVTAIAAQFLPTREPWEALGITMVESCYRSLAAFERPLLVVAATDDGVVNSRVAREARALGILVARVDDAADSDVTFPATLRRGHLTVSFATDGLAPAVARLLRQQAEASFDERHARLVEVEAGLGRQPSRLGPDITLGLVSLVGAGPGDPELLTLKAVARLRRADVVVHDDLVSSEIMDIHAPTARRIDVGKRKGRCYLKQEAINALLVDLGRQALRVVRLKGGDPCLFGRTEEERAALRQAGVPYEIVAGVSSLAAVPAAAGIVVTNRDDARSLGAYSLHKRDGQGPSEVEWAEMAKGPDTLVLFMGRSRLREACARLVAGGRDAETPAALIVAGTLPGQQAVHATLQTLPEAAAAVPAEGPGLIVVGAACGRASARPDRSLTVSTR
jgi:uroporphyrin-III C-methyltransferase / precorrin-2 dehydrogenase / sirohydrochlorin ferrochelatase